jgi:hypothetical protein
VQVVAEVAKEYGVVDQDGNLPASLRSLRFVLPIGLPILRQYSWLVPDIKVPWIFLKAFSSPKI